MKTITGLCGRTFCVDEESEQREENMRRMNAENSEILVGAIMFIVIGLAICAAAIIGFHLLK